MNSKVTKDELRILKSERAQLISILSALNLTLENEIKVSSAGGTYQDTYELVVSFVNHINSTNFNTLQKELEKEIGLACKVFGNKISVDFRDLVKKKVQLLDLATKTTVKEVPPISSIPVNPLEGSYLLQDIRSVLENTISRTELKDASILKQKATNKNVAELILGSKYNKSRIFFELEKAGYTVVVIDQTFYISMDKMFLHNFPIWKNNVQNIGRCIKFVFSIQKWIRDNRIQVEVLTHPYFIAITMFKEKLDIKYEHEIEMFMIKKMLKLNQIDEIIVDSEKNIMSITLNHSALVIPFIDAIVKAEDMESEILLEEEKAPVVQEVETPTEIVKETVQVSPKNEVEIVVVSNNVENVSAPKRVNATFLNEVRGILGNIIPMEKLEKAYYLKKRHDNDKAGELLEINKFIRTKALYALEEAGYSVMVSKSIVIFCKNDSYIKSLKDYKRNATKFETAQSFVRNLKAWMKANGVDAKFLTHPVHIANTVFNEQLEIYCPNSNNSIKLQRLFVMLKVKARLVVNMLYVNLGFVPVTSFANVDIDTSGIPDVPTPKGVLTYVDAHGSVHKVFKTYDYNSIHFLSFNRDIDWDHVDEIGHSIDEFGVFEFIKVVKTACIDGTERIWIVDGQHTFWALVMRGMPIEYVIIQVEDKKEVVRLISVANNKRKPWNNKNYLDAWLSIHDPMYDRLGYWVKEEKFPLFLALFIISGKTSKVAIKDFRDGNLDADETVDFEKILRFVNELRPFFPKKTMIMENLVKFIKRHEDFNVSIFKNTLLGLGSTFRESFGTEDTGEIVMSKLTELYPVKLLAEV